jgi:hypothetical protein
MYHAVLYRARAWHGLTWRKAASFKPSSRKEDKEGSPKQKEDELCLQRIRAGIQKDGEKGRRKRNKAPSNLLDWLLLLLEMKEDEDLV